MANVLKEFMDVIPHKSSRILPPHRSVDHHIELELGVIPLVRPPYNIASLKLQSLVSN